MDAKPDLLFLITAHHPPSQLNRTFRVAIGSKRLYLCSRCLGQWIAFYTIVSWCIFVSPVVLDIPTSLIIYIGLPLPGALDWLTQIFGYRESNNAIRVITGGLYGAALGLYVASLVRGRWPMVAVGSLVFLLYFVCLIWILRHFDIASDFLFPYEEFVQQGSTD